MKKPCPKCFNFISSKLSECPICHADLKKNSPKTSLVKEVLGDSSTKNKISPNLEAIAKEAEERNKLEQVAVVSGDESKNSSEKKDIYHQKNGRVKWVPKYKREGWVSRRQKVANPRITGVHIDISDVSYFEKHKNKYNPSNKLVTDIGGKYELEKLEWWEIYKWADRQLAKRKINKYVKKESVKRPEGVSYWILFFLSLFTGYLGLHNFYAGNYKKGIVSAVSFTIAFGFVIFLEKIAFFHTYMQGLLCAVPGLIAIFIWVSDFLSICIKRFKFRKSKLAYIKTLDIETRARLGKKYIYIV